MTPPLDTDDHTPAWNGKIFSGGWVAGAAGVLAVTAPGTGRPVASVGVASAADVDRAVGIAKAAQREWAALPYDQRTAVLRNAAALLTADPHRLRRWLAPESGSAQGKARRETGLVVSKLHESATLAARPYGELLRSAKRRFSFSRRVPLGVIGVISPFNFPALLSMRSVAPALAVGNAVILKPDPRTPISGGLA